MVLTNFDARSEGLGASQQQEGRSWRRDSHKEPVKTHACIRFRHVTHNALHFYIKHDARLLFVSVFKCSGRIQRGGEKNIWVPTSSFKTSSQTEIISSLPQLVHACTSRSSTRDRAAARRRRERIIGFTSCLLTYRPLSNSVPWSEADAICIGRLAESCCLVKSIKMHAVCSLCTAL